MHKCNLIIQKRGTSGEPLPVRSRWQYQKLSQKKPIILLSEAKSSKLWQKKWDEMENTLDEMWE